MIKDKEDVNNLMQILTEMYPNGMVPAVEVERVQKIIETQRRCRPMSNPIEKMTISNSLRFVVQHLAERKECAPSCLNPVLYDSKIEYLFAVTLHEYGLEWIPRFRVGKYRLDFAFPEIRFDVEVDGVTYHGSPDQQRRDKARDKYLNSKGWLVYRLSAWDAEHKNGKHIDRIRQTISQRSKARVIE